MFFDLPAKEIETNVSLPKFKDEAKNSKRKEKNQRENENPAADVTPREAKARPVRRL